jgi:DNA-binding response OmpR family regulator
MSDSPPVLLIVDDEREVADLFATYVDDPYDVRVAYNGEDALDAYDESVDFVLLDRRMPDMAGDEVLSEIRSRPGECRVAMVTAVDPDFDVLDMKFDAYLTKPITEAELRETIENLGARATYREEIQQYFSLVTKRAALRAEKHPGALEQDERYQALETEIEALESELGDIVDTLTVEDYSEMFNELSRE